MKKIILLLIIIITASCSETTPEPENFPATISFTEIGKGTLTGTGFEKIPVTNTVINNKAAWTDLLAKMNSVENISKTFNETEINFETHTAVVLILELKGTGWSVEINDIIENSENIVVNATETNLSTLIDSQPFHIVLIPKTEKQVVFSINSDITCNTLINCNDAEDENQAENLNGIWSIKNISGGIAGIDDNYETGIITWTFNNQILIVENNESQGNIYSGFESGTYNYSINEINGNNYIIINNDEYGGYTFSINNLTINQNETSNGSGADGFILRLVR